LHRQVTEAAREDVTMQRPFAPPTGRLNGPQHAWETALRLGDFSIRDLVGLSNGMARSAVTTMLYAWRDAGLVEQIARPTERDARGHLLPAVWRITPAGRKLRSAPVVRRSTFTGAGGRAQQHMWNAMRTLDAFTNSELRVAASTDDVVITESNAGAYVRALIRSGRLNVRTPHTKAAGRGVGAIAGVYSLKPSANTGPKALKIMRKGVFDPNMETLHPYERTSS
jgi:hypothetical protein